MRNPGLTMGILAGAAVLALSGFEYGPALASSSTAASGSSHAAPSSPAVAGQTAAKASDDRSHGQAGATGGSHWGYQGSTGPANWGRLSKDYHLCADGAEQIKQIAAVMGANARPVQPTGQRLVLAPAAGH